MDELGSVIDKTREGKKSLVVFDFTDRVDAEEYKRIINDASYDVAFISDNWDEGHYRIAFHVVELTGKGFSRKYSAKNSGESLVVDEDNNIVEDNQEETIDIDFSDDAEMVKRFMKSGM